MIDHREGCPVVRTGRCTCANLAQWDEAEKDPDFWTKPAATNPAPIFPMEEKAYYPSIDKPIKALTVDGEIWEPRQLRHDEEVKTRYWHKEYKELRRRFIAMTVLAITGWAFSVARGIWGF